MPFYRTAERSPSQQTSSFRLRPSGVLRAAPQAPQFIALGTATSSIAGISVSWPTRHQSGDLAILVTESSGNDSTVTPSGWSHIPGSPVTDIATTAGTKLSVYYRFALSDQEAVAAVPDPGDHVLGRIITFRNVRTDVVPGRVSAANTSTVAAASITWGQILTPTPNSMVVCVAATPASTPAYSTFFNASLSGTTLAGSASTTSGNAGSFVIYYGTAAAIGTINASTVNLSTALTNASLVFALEPSLALPA